MSGIAIFRKDNNKIPGNQNKLWEVGDWSPKVEGCGRINLKTVGMWENYPKNERDVGGE